MTWFSPNAKISTKDTRERIIRKGLANKRDLAWAWRINRNWTGSEVGENDQSILKTQNQMNNWILCRRGQSGKEGRASHHWEQWFTSKTPGFIMIWFQPERILLPNIFTPMEQTVILLSNCLDTVQLKPPSSYWGKGKWNSQKSMESRTVSF